MTAQLPSCKLASKSCLLMCEYNVNHLGVARSLWKRDVWPACSLPALQLLRGKTIGRPALANTSMYAHSTVQLPAVCSLIRYAFTAY
jgi:hypothetical protein